ncbi:MAG: Rieske 2Fe-2S domain-containing protein [Chloroflexi bacterium]|nr:Rieske 2Fe-2S domain-containing protein [Chloroflexota bacterium]
MLARLFTRLVDINGPWARPLGNLNVRLLRALFRPLWPLKDFLNGKWLGHSLHGALTDFAIGALLSVSVLDVLGYGRASDALLGVSILVMVGASIAGLADYSDTDGLPRTRATVHATVMTSALVVYIVSWVIRSGGPADRTLPIVLALVGAVLVSVGAWIGGDVVYALGNMIDRHAWRFWAKPKWQALDVAEIPEGTLVKAKAGTQSLVLVRNGNEVMAIHDVCAHAGGILSDGSLEAGGREVECPLHGSRYELATGYKRRGPTTFDQPRYEVRRSQAGGWEALRIATHD